MKTLLLFILATLSLGHGDMACAQVTNYNGLNPKYLQDPNYLFFRLDDPTQKQFLAGLLSEGVTKLGVVDMTNQAYLQGATGVINGTYPLLDAISGSQLVLQPYSLVDDARLFVPATFTTGATVSVGTLQGLSNLIAPTQTSSLTINSYIQGIPAGVSTGVVLTGATSNPLSVVITGATATAGRFYLMIRQRTNLQ